MNILITNDDGYLAPVVILQDTTEPEIPTTYCSLKSDDIQLEANKYDTLTKTKDTENGYYNTAGAVILDDSDKYYNMKMMTQEESDLDENNAKIQEQDHAYLNANFVSQEN